MNNGGKGALRRAGLATTLATAALAAPSAQAGIFGDDFSWDIGGFVRQETAVSTVGIENPNNQGGNFLQNQTATRQAFLPPGLLPGGQLINWGDIPLPYRSDVKRSDFVDSTDNDFNWVVLRGEVELGAKFGEHWDFVARLRALYQPDVYDDFNANSLDGLQGGIDGGDPRLYHGKVNYFDYFTESGKRGNPLEWTGRNYQAYFPAMVLNYRDGGLNVRVGNQTIAWGQSIYLRVFDVPNGIDLRRHLILDRGLEEFSDKRVPMLSARMTYQVTDSILADAYVGKFQPSVFGNPGTPYNVIPVQFTVHDLYEPSLNDTRFSGGMRLKGDYGDWGWQAAYVNRVNPDGVFRWTNSNVEKPLQGGPGSLASLVNTAYAAKLPAAACGANYDPSLCRRYANTGEAIANSPLEASPGGVYSADEWFTYAGHVRLNGVTGLNAAINDFDGSQDLYATPVENYEQAAAQLNTFFIGAGGSLRGHIAREYFREDVIMLGGSYVNSSDNDFLNELIFNLEAQYIPNRTFTATDLGKNFKQTDEYTISLVVDKWHRFFNEFPGTYIVFEALTKNRSDLVGRLLEGYGGTKERAAPGKKGNANYLVLGFLQPWPNKLYELEFATLFDPDGGIFVQPGVRWHPGGDVTVEGFYNYTNGHLWGKKNNNLIDGLDFAQEFTLRLSYQF
ncbi:hypothetical protein SAMN04488068_1161 [Hydrocarboniphaga daqingensis]|uniref:DUF1302 domain-containing protein n=1 Tax=Hydrocarboniphaga daqingensis TaxID=490188 RepID=A0A1M5LYG8_9GAMM|nr:DUF1302 family protein [Hydrocarboniphaga daqingensis]SHG69970.1 hypothetical protein SAMN04488068_1161 [Hydrocarboniphaga daqingensis]